MPLSLTTTLLLASLLLPREAPEPGRIQVGDLVFQDLDCGPICDAIEDVTQGVDHARLSHVALVSRVEPEGIMVIEAYAHGVVELPLSELLPRSKDKDGNPKVFVMTIKNRTDASAADAVARARTLLGRPYDSSFVLKEDALYCAELLNYACRTEGSGSLFPPAPMTFKAPGREDFQQAWVDYYKELGLPIPQGEPGVNPADMTRNPALELRCSFGRPDGWTGDGPACR